MLKFYLTNVKKYGFIYYNNKLLNIKSLKIRYLFLENLFIYKYNEKRFIYGLIYLQETTEKSPDYTPKSQAFTFYIKNNYINNTFSGCDGIGCEILIVTFSHPKVTLSNPKSTKIIYSYKTKRGSELQ